MNTQINHTGLASSAPVPALQPTVGVATAGTGKAQSAKGIISTSAPHASNAADVDGLDETAKVALSGWWSDQCQNAGAEWRKNELHGSTLRRRTVAMLSLEVALFPNTNWDERLVAANVDTDNIRSKHKLAKAVAATFALDPAVEDKTVARQAGKMIDRLSLSVEWLANKITTMSPAELKGITFDDSGIEKLVAVLMTVGGVTRASDAQRAINNATPTGERSTVVVNRQGGVSRLVKRGQAQLRKRDGLGDDADVPVKVKVTFGKKDVPFTLPASMIEMIKAKIFEQAAQTDPVVDLLGELVCVGAAVKHEANRGKQADQGNSEMRVGSRQFVLRPDRSVLISPVVDLTSEDFSGPVIVARPSSPLTKTAPSSCVRVSNEGLGFVEGNLVDTGRRKFFDAEVSPVDSAGAVSIELVTSIVGSDTTSSYRVDLHPVEPGLAHYPLEANAAKFTPNYVFEVSLADFATWSKAVPAKASKRPSPAQLMTDGVAASLYIEEHGVEEAPLKQGTGNAIIEFPLNELRKVVKCMETLTLAGSGVRFEVDPAMGMRVCFKTELAAYEAFLPLMSPVTRKYVKAGFQPISVR